MMKDGTFVCTIRPQKFRGEIRKNVRLILTLVWRRNFVFIIGSGLLKALLEKQAASIYGRQARRTGALIARSCIGMAMY